MKLKRREFRHPVWVYTGETETYKPGLFGKPVTYDKRRELSFAEVVEEVSQFVETRKDRLVSLTEHTKHPGDGRLDDSITVFVVWYWED
jgi:alpha-D-ribose 1-methylphosphonate 5-triphosphate diphosphatase PhnM